MIFRGFTYRLASTAIQEERFLQFAGVCCLVWNLALEQRRDYWRNYHAATGDNLNYVTQARELTKLRAEVDFVRAVSQTSQQFVLKALDEAFQRAVTEYRDALAERAKLHAIKELELYQNRLVSEKNAQRSIVTR